MGAARRHDRARRDRDQLAGFDLEDRRSPLPTTAFVDSVASAPACGRSQPPLLKAADLTARVMGRTATVRINNAVADLAVRAVCACERAVRRCRHGPEAAALAHLFLVEVRRRGRRLCMDGARLPRIRIALPGDTKGTFVAHVAWHTPDRRIHQGRRNYAIEATLPFSAEKLARGQKVEANSLKLSANSQGYQTRGDIRLNGLPVNVDYRKPAGTADAEVRLAMTLDDAARSRLGFDLGSTMTGAIPLKMHGRIGASDRDSRFQVEADLKDAKIAELLPGWWKAAGRPARATFTLIDKPQSMRFEDLVSRDPDPVKGLSSSIPAATIVLRASRISRSPDATRRPCGRTHAADGTLKVTMRGELFDGRGIVKSAFGTPTAEKNKNATTRGDFDLDVKLGTVAGYNGETLRAVEVRMSRRAGHIRSFLLNGKIGPNGQLIGDMRATAAARCLHRATTPRVFRFRHLSAHVAATGVTIVRRPRPRAADGACT